MPEFLSEIEEASASGVDIIELRLDFINDFNPEADLATVMAACKLPYIITFRPTWEGGNYDGPEHMRLAVLQYAAMKGAPYIDVELKAAPVFFAGQYVNLKQGAKMSNTRIILSSHNFQSTPSEHELHELAATMREAGADIVKIACFANDICDSARVLSLLQRATGPVIAIAMGEKGQITRLLAAKYRAFLTFASMSAERASAPGQPTVAQLKGLYNFGAQSASTKLYGIIGNPVGHSKSPLIHNTAFQHIGFDGVYVPLLVDALDTFLAAFARHDFAGYSVTIPHKEAALRLADSADDVAVQIGAVNTLVRQADGSLRGFNTDWSAAINAIEDRLRGSSGDASSSSSGGGAEASASKQSPLHGKTFVVLGAGGAGRALAFGAANRGARVVIANRNQQRAQQLAADVPGGATVAPYDDVYSGAVAGDVLANTTPIGMHATQDQSPVAAAALSKYTLVFDAVYTPRFTRLLRDAEAAGCQVVDGVQMFVGQAVDQFGMFTQRAAPTEVMERVVVGGS